MGQLCTITKSSGTLAGADVTNVAPGCANTFTIGGTATGLTCTLALQNNLGDDLSLTGNGSFIFATALPDGSAYDVTVLTQPLGQTCTITNATGTLAGISVTNVAADCVTHFAFMAYVVNPDSDDVTTFRIDPSTGALSEVGTEVAAGVSPRTITILGSRD